MMPYAVKVQEVDPQPILAVRYVTPPADIGSVMGEAIARVFAHVGMTGGTPVGPPLSVYHRFDEESVDFEVGVPVAAPVPDAAPAGPEEPPQVRMSELPGGTVATTVHVGPYDGLETAWTAVTDWIREHGHESADLPCWESYLSDPQSEPDPARWQTQLFVPLKS